MSKPQQRGYSTCIPFVPCLRSSREVRGKHQFRLRAHRTLGATVILTGTHQDQLHNRAQCTKMPRSRLAGSPAQYVTFSSASLSATDIALHNSKALSCTSELSRQSMSKTYMACHTCT